MDDGTADGPTFIAVIEEDLREGSRGYLAFREGRNGDGVFDGAAVAATVESDWIRR